MRLKSLKLAGFKSFANATTFTFPRGITAIVGPNGCGKSNVIDAIRWVLGETSAKQLRGGAMSDVIFVGTQDKAAKSVASVELTFEHTQDEQTGIRHELNLYHELSVRRQVNMEGRSDYFINGTRARRRDVVDVFLGTGLGARSYAVIEQGMIGRIVDSSPMQLREFIEEAAGVSRYQARREETQKKLEATQDNLARLQDMQSELLRQQKTLLKQASIAERYQALTQMQADTQQQLAIQQLYQAKEAQQKIKLQHEKSSAKAAILQSDYDVLKAKQDKLNAQMNQEQWLKDEAQSAYHQQQLTYQQAAHQLSNAQATIAQTQEQLASIAEQSELALAESEQLKSEQADLQVTLTSLRPKLDELVAQRQVYEQDEQPLQQAWNETQNNLNTLQDRLRALEQEHALNQQAKRRYEHSYAKWQTRQQHWQNLYEQLPSSRSNDSSANTNNNNDNNNDNNNTDDKLQTKIASLNSTDALNLLAKKIQQIGRQQDNIALQLETLQPQAYHMQQRLTDEQRKLSELEKQHALLAGEYDTLHHILHPKPISHSDSRTEKCSETSEHHLGNASLPISTLREQIELSTIGQQYAPVLDKVLALWLDSHVLMDNAAKQTANKDDSSEAQPVTNLAQALAPALAELLIYQQTRPSAQTTHSLWLPAKPAHNHADTSTAMPNALSDNVLPLSQLIVKPALALWQQCYLYIEDQRAQNLASVLELLPPSALLLTSDGWIIGRQGTLNLHKLLGAKDSSDSQFLSQRLQQRNRLVQLEDELDATENQIALLQNTIKNSQNEYDALSVNLTEMRTQNEQLTRAKYQYEQQLSTEQAVFEREQADIKRLDNDKIALEQERQELADEQHALDHEQQRTRAAMERLLPKLAQAKNKRQQLQNQRHERSRLRKDNDERWQALQLEVQKLELRLEHSSSRLMSARQVHDKLLQREQTLATQLERLKPQLPELQNALETAQLVRDEQQALLNARDTALNELRQYYEQQQSELDTLQNALQEQQSARANQATELALSEARLEDASSRAHSALERYYQLSAEHKPQEPPTQRTSVSSLLTDFIIHERRVRPDKIAELQAEQSKLEQQLSKIGAVNLAAVSELKEVNERLEPLTQHIDDITASMDTLIGAIADIDETTKSLFMQTLDAVNSELAKLFAKVFGGGQASLTLNTDDLPADIPVDKRRDEQWRAGLTLMAQPKGKRNSRLAVLSGGEKTLTALSLIFAIFKQHPAPFCVLDEVDAPLDDANVARFTSLINELADDLQFIFISHNKLSMQIADELKGITMPNAGISTLVSVSLDEAAQYIES